jgi:hypothetical protein
MKMFFAKKYQISDLPLAQQQEINKGLSVVRPFLPRVRNQAFGLLLLIIPLLLMCIPLTVALDDAIHHKQLWRYKGNEDYALLSLMLLWFGSLLLINMASVIYKFSHVHYLMASFGFVQLKGQQVKILSFPRFPKGKKWLFITLVTFVLSIFATLFVTFPLQNNWVKQSIAAEIFIASEKIPQNLTADKEKLKRYLRYFEEKEHYTMVRENLQGILKKELSVLKEKLIQEDEYPSSYKAKIREYLEYFKDKNYQEESQVLDKSFPEWKKRYIP